MDRGRGEFQFPYLREVPKNKRGTYKKIYDAFSAIDYDR